MPVSKDTVEHTARLAMLKLDDNKLTDTTSSINDVLLLIDELQSVDTSGIEAMAHPLDAVAPLREDIPATSIDRDALLANAPEQQDGQFLVPRVVE